jgi:hypothetical protein
VLGKFTPSERPAIDDAVATAVDAVECWATQGIEIGMNKFNYCSLAAGLAPRGPNRPASCQMASEFNTWQKKQTFTRR